MSQKLCVSVVMPSYDQATFIGQAIDSVLSQDYDALDLLVMDGKSTDKTVELLKSYGSRITFIWQEDRGQSDAINQGFAQADGDIGIYTSTDWISPRVYALHQ